MKNIVFVVSEVGYTWDEVIIPYIEFKKYGYNVEFSTVTGGKAKVDPFSVIVRPLLSKFGFGTSRKISETSGIGKELLQKMNSIIPIKEIDSEKYEGIFLAGGHGALFDVNKNEEVHKVILDFYKKNKKLAAICHASSTLGFVNYSGHSLIEDKAVTGFPTFQENIILKFNMINESFLPLPIWTGKELDKHSKKGTLH